MKRAFGLNIPQTLEEVCDPQRIALLVYDMQVGILSQIENADQVTRQVLKVLTAAREARERQTKELAPSSSLMIRPANLASFSRWH